MTSAEPTLEKRRGAYYTPRWLADFLVRWALRSADDTVLDPACGEAVFLQAAIDRLRDLGANVETGQVSGTELDPEAVFAAVHTAPVAVVMLANFFEQSSDGATIDAVVGNPPYIRYHHFSGSVRDRALERARHEGVNLTQLTSSWAPFVVHAATFLKPAGRLAFVLPAELLTTDYAGPVRDFLRNRFGRVDVLTFEERVFPGALVDAVLLLAEGQGPGIVRIHRLRNAASLQNFNPDTGIPTIARKWTHALISSDASEALSLASHHMQPLGTLASIDIGVVTGANRFFLLSDQQAQDLKLISKQLRRVVARGQQLPGTLLTAEAWEQQRESGDIVWLFTPGSDEEAAGAYIRRGEKDGVNNSYKCRIRSPWWRLKLPDPPDLILSYMSNHAPRLVANEAGVLTTNLLHNVRLLDHTDAPARSRTLARSWPNSATMLSCELTGRTYGGGVLKLETREAERVLVPALTPTVTDQLNERAEAIGVLLCRGAIEAAADLVDCVVLADLAPEVRSALRAAWLDLRSRRKRRASPAKQLR